ncbi:MAG TPA: hypothetical protein IAB30_04045 [Candidatus Fimenecus excrementavium]|nr:hypothetical protein [Candidatus Fimenecus excrementavium]
MSPIDIVILVLAVLAVGTLIYKKARVWKHGGGCNGCDGCQGCNKHGADCANCAYRETNRDGK